MLESLREHVAPIYAVFDPAHRMQHIDNVLHLSTRLSTWYYLTPTETRLTRLAVYCHDLGLLYGREEHHNHSADIVLTRTLPVIKDLPDDELKVVADACREHRASGSGVYSSKVSEVVAASDRGRPDFWALYQRIASNFEHLTPEARKAEVHAHMRKKYGSAGYVKYPEFYSRVFRCEIEALRCRIDSIIP